MTISCVSYISPASCLLPPASYLPLQGNMKDNPFESVDPAPAARKPSKEQVPEFERQLLDTTLPLFERYKAMFSLRNNRSRAAILVRACVRACVWLRLNL